MMTVFDWGGNCPALNNKTLLRSVKCKPPMTGNRFTIVARHWDERWTGFGG